jgi:hypothetical protein
VHTADGDEDMEIMSKIDPRLFEERLEGME